MDLQNHPWQSQSSFTNSSNNFCLSGKFHLSSILSTVQNCHIHLLTYNCLLASRAFDNMTGSGTAYTISNKFDRGNVFTLDLIVHSMLRCVLFVWMGETGLDHDHFLSDYALAYLLLDYNIHGAFTQYTMYHRRTLNILLITEYTYTSINKLYHPRTYLNTAVILIGDRMFSCIMEEFLICVLRSGYFSQSIDGYDCKCRSTKFKMEIFVRPAKIKAKLWTYKLQITSDRSRRGEDAESCSGKIRHFFLCKRDHFLRLFEEIEREYPQYNGTAEINIWSTILEQVFTNQLDAFATEDAVVVSNEGFSFITCYTESRVSFDFYSKPFDVYAWTVLFLLALLFSCVLTLCLKFLKLNLNDFNPWMFCICLLFEESYEFTSNVLKHNLIRMPVIFWLLI